MGKERNDLQGMALEDRVAALSRAPLFRDVELPQLRLLAFSAQEHDFENGRCVAREGAKDAPAYLVIQGTLDIAGQEVGAGVLINAPGALADVALRAAVTAKTDARLLVIDRALVARLITEYPAMGRAMMRAAGADLRQLAGGIRAQLRMAAQR